MTTTWMPIYWGDYFKDTLHLSAEEHGAYFLLMGHYWCNGKIPRDINILKNITRLSEKKLSNVLAFFEIDGAYYSHRRIDEELRKAAENKQKKSEAGKKGMQQRYNRATNSVITEPQQKPNPSPSPSPIDTSVSIKEKINKKENPYTKEFLEFWKVYPPNAGSKKKAFEVWNKITGVDYGSIARAAEDYRRYLDRAGITAAHGATWLYQERWEVRYTELEPDTRVNAGTRQGQGYGKPSRKSILDDQLQQALAGIQREAETTNAERVARSSGESNPDFISMLPNDGNL
jgi:uncharacterized protein YdaU (DUF1376 family)